MQPAKSPYNCIPPCNLATGPTKIQHGNKAEVPNPEHQVMNMLTSGAGTPSSGDSTSRSSPVRERDMLQSLTTALTADEQALTLTSKGVEALLLLSL